MAEALVLGAITGAIAGALLDEVIARAKNAYRCKENCDNLLSTLESVKPLLDGVSQSADIGNTTCQDWLKDMYAVLFKAKDILGDCVVQRSRFSLKYVKKWRVSSSIKDIDGRIKEKIPHANLLTLGIVQGIYQIMTMEAMTPAIVMQPVPCNIVAFEKDPFKQVKDLVIAAADAVGDSMTIGLKGGGGAGKTLIAKMVNNDKDVQEKYSMILWITIGMEVSIPDVYKTMGKFLNNGGIFERDHAHRNLEDQRNYLMEAFKLKKMLLILDDVWEKSRNNHAMIHWLDVCKGPGSATLITTRNDVVLKRAKAKEKIDFLSLSKEESWKLFCNHAFGTSILPGGQLENVAREICEECKGLPLAVEVIGSALCEKDIRDWSLALSRLKGARLNSKEVEDELFHRLKFSYDDLEEDIKKCFLYFAAFPEDYEITTKQLCSIWIAERMFGSLDDEDMCRQMSMEALTVLADRCLIDLREDGVTAKVHDVLRDLAIRIINEAKAGEWASECYFELGKGLRIFPRMKAVVKRVSLVGSSVEDWYSEGMVNLAHVQVLLLSRFNTERLEEFWEAFMRGMIQLVYLDLSKSYTLKKLPEVIKELKSLMYLDLSRCSSLKELPKGIKELKSLVYLNLSRCSSLKELPEGIKELKCLTYLDLLGFFYLKKLPEGIKELKSLMHLDISRCYSLKELPEDIKELKSLTYLSLSWCYYLEKLLEDIKELKFLTYMDLSGCHYLKELPKDIKELKSLTYMDLSGCHYLKELPEGIKELKFLTHLDL